MTTKLRLAAAAAAAAAAALVGGEQVDRKKPK